MKPIRVSNWMTKELDKLLFSEPVACVYNPLSYAKAPLCDYLGKFGEDHREILFLGMNPGPWGMAQTGVPFGEIGFVRDWLGIKGQVNKPVVEHPKRPIQGFDCTRSEVSGARVWGWAKTRFETPKRFFDRFFVVNYCPLVFMEESGKNRTPDKLPRHEQKAVFDICDEGLRKLVRYYGAKWVVGIGAFAEGRAKVALNDTDVQIGRILHPSPASPIANRGWAEAAEKQLANLGLLT